MTVLVKKLGGSVAVVIPKSVAREMELREGTPLEITSDASGMVLRRRGRRLRRPLREILSQVDSAAYRRRNTEFAADKPWAGKSDEQKDLPSRTWGSD